MARVGANLLLVRPGEGSHVAYFFGFFFLLGAGMALGRGTADALFLKRYGVHYLPLMYVLLSGSLAITSIAYAVYADRIEPERLFARLFHVLAAIVASSWLVMRGGWFDSVYPFYFLVYEISSELLLVHSALYFSKNFELLQSKRLSALVLAGMQLGVITGGIGLALMVPVSGTQNALLAWAGLLLIASHVLQRWHGKHGRSVHFRSQSRARAKEVQGRTGAQIGHVVRGLMRSELLRAASVALFFMVVAFYVLNYSVNRIYAETFRSEASLSMFFGYLVALSSGAALLLQMFATNRAIGRFGVRKVNLVFPMTTVFSFFGLLLSFSFVPALIGSFNKDAVLPAFRNPVRNVMYAALPDRIQGRARAVSIAAVIPLALLVCGAVLWFVQYLSSPVYFLLLGALAALAYLTFSVRMNKAYGKEIVGSLRKTLALPGADDAHGLRSRDPAYLRELIKGVSHSDARVAVPFARALLAADRGHAVRVILDRAHAQEPAIQDRLLRLLSDTAADELESHVLAHVGASDEHLRATMWGLLFDLRSAAGVERVPEALQSDSPRMVAVGIRGAFVYGLEAWLPVARRRWVALLESSREQDNLAGLEVRARVAPGQVSPSFLESATNCVLRNLGAESRARIVALDAAAHWIWLEAPALTARLQQLLEEGVPEVRRRCLEILGRHGRPGCEALLRRACEDFDPVLRERAVALLDDGSMEMRERLVAMLNNDSSVAVRAKRTVLAHLQAVGMAPSTLLAIAEALAEESVRTVDWLAAVRCRRQDSAALQILQFALSERVEQLIDLSLMALQPLAQFDGVASIRFGLKSSDVRDRARACEGLQLVENVPFARKWSIAMERLRHDDGPGSAADLNLPASLTTIARRADPWLRKCALAACTGIGNDRMPYARSV